MFKHDIHPYRFFYVDEIDDDINILKQWQLFGISIRASWVSENRNNMEHAEPRAAPPTTIVIKIGGKKLRREESLLDGCRWGGLDNARLFAGNRSPAGGGDQKEGGLV